MTALSRLKWEAFRIAHGVPWYAWGGLIAVIGSVLVALFVVIPVQERNETSRLELAALQSKPAGTGLTAQPPSQLANFYARFPAASALPDALNNILSLGTKANLVLDQGDYRLTAVPTIGLTRYELNLPVKGTYAQIRQFVAEALKEHPTLALQSVAFSRDAVGRTTLDAQLRFVLYARKSEP